MFKKFTNKNNQSQTENQSSPEQEIHSRTQAHEVEESQKWTKKFKSNPAVVGLVTFWKKYHLTKLLMAFILTLITLVTGYLVYSAKTADVSKLKAGLSQETIVYDRTSQEAGTLNVAKGEFVPLSQVSSNVVDALVSTEDKRFYSHHGVDPIGIMRALVGYVTNFGEIVGGGSTITQQLAKNAYLTADQTLWRKAKELFLSFEIEKRYSKDEILEMYLNNSYFGNGAYGIENAAKRYFGKPASDLTVSEASILVGALKAPSYYNPIDNLDATINRRATVLQLMADNGKISQETADATASETIYLADTYVASSSYRYPYYFDAVIDEIVNNYGISEEDLLDKGYQVYTGLDQQLQYDMEDTFRNNWVFPDAEDGTKVQGASVALDPTTGDVLATVGGRVEDNHTFRGFNRATQMHVQPGSTFKPLAVYTAALEAGYTPESLLTDERLSYGEDKYTPENWNFAYQGKVTMTEAISQSWNAPAVWLLDQIGLQKGIDKVHQFGIPTVADDNYLGIALGGLTAGVSPIQMASAYTAFANAGLRSQARFVTKIVDATGAIIVDNTTPKQNRVTSPQVADQMTSMLLAVFAPGGGGSHASPTNYQIAGKTGTTESVSDQVGSRDQWMIGYTPNIVVATWMGFDDSSQHLLAASSSGGIAPLFQMEMSGLLSITPETDFTVTAAGQSDNQTETGSSGDDWLQQAQDTGRQLFEGVRDWANDAFNWLRNQTE